MTKPPDRFGGDFSAEEMSLSDALRKRFSAEDHACPSPDLLRAAAEHALPDEIQEQIDDHVANCSVCATLQQDLHALNPAPPDSKLLQGIRQRIPVPKAKLWSGWMRPAPLFATLAILALAAWAARSWYGRSLNTSRTAQSQPVQAVVAPKVVEIAVAKAPITVPGDIALSWRGASTHDRPSLQEWTTALAPYKNDDFARASNLLTAVTRQYPKFGDASFYLGVSELLQQKNESAVSALQQALQHVDADRRSEAAWYLGAAYARLGQTAEAANRWRPICEGHSEYSQQACEDLNHLKLAR